MSDATQPTPQPPACDPADLQIVGSYLSDCRPPVAATTAQTAAAVAAWNRIAQAIGAQQP